MPRWSSPSRSSGRRSPRRSCPGGSPTCTTSRRSPATRSAGLPIISIAGAITTIFLGWVIYEWLSNSLYGIGIGNTKSIKFLAASLWPRGRSYVVARLVPPLPGHRPRRDPRGDPGRVTAAQSIRWVGDEPAHRIFLGPGEPAAGRSGPAGWAPDAPVLGPSHQMTCTCDHPAPTLARLGLRSSVQELDRSSRLAGRFRSPGAGIRRIVASNRSRTFI